MDFPKKMLHLPAILILAVATLSPVSASETTGAPEQPGGKTTVFTIGDSTMADKKPEVAPETGWCQALPSFFDSTIVVRNMAVNGRSTKSFITEGRWKAVTDALKPGDWVFIQFGHNDAKSQDTTRFTDPLTTYRQNLEKFVRETREKGAYPVLITSIVRRKFEKGMLVDTHGDYPVATRLVAAAMNVPLVDLQLLTAGAVTATGEEPSKNIYLWTPPSARFPEGRKDDTHLSGEGATLVARLAVQQMAMIRLPLAEHVKAH